MQDLETLGNQRQFVDGLVGTGEGVVYGEDISRIPCTEGFLIDDTDTFTFDRIVGIDYLSLGKRIKKIRERSGITQLALADLTGLARSYIGQIESGLKNASLETIVAIANSSNCELSRGVS